MSLVDFLLKAGAATRLDPSISHAAVLLLDRYLMTESATDPQYGNLSLSHKFNSSCGPHSINPQILQSAAMACISLSHKFFSSCSAQSNSELIFGLIAEFRQSNGFCKKNSHNCSSVPKQCYPANVEAKLVKSMEWTVMKTLSYDFGCLFTPLHFIEYYNTKGLLFVNDRCRGFMIKTNHSNYLSQWCTFFTGFCCRDYFFQQYTASHLAAAIVLASRNKLNIAPLWRSELTTTTGYSRGDVTLVFNILMEKYALKFPDNVVEDQNKKKTKVKGCCL